jgi:CRP/FNR family transcriptional regulator, cyclic AMP receptor protein
VASASGPIATTDCDHTMDDAELLSRSELFSTFDRSALENISVAAHPVECERNFVIFEEGDQAGELFVVQSGRIAIGRQSVDGRESLVALMETGDVFGEMPLFDGGTRSATARSLERSLIHGIPYDVVKAALDARPELLWNVVTLLAERLRSTDSALADAVLLDVTGRTAKWLLELAGDQPEFQLPITQEELAGLVGASRERVNKAIAAFIRLGWIDQMDRRYRILERERLAQRAR